MPDNSGGIDTSSYKLPTQPSFLDIAGKYQGLQSGQLGIQGQQISNEQQQLALIQKRFAIVSGQIPALLSKKDLNQKDIEQFYQDQVNNKFMTPDMFATSVSQIPPTAGMNKDDAALTLKNHMGSQLQKAQSVMEALNYHLGEKGSENTNAAINPTLSSPKPGFAGNPQAGGVIQPQPGIPIQPGPTTPQMAPGGTTDENGQPISRGTPTIRGAAAPRTGLPVAPGALPVGPAPVPPGMRIGGGKVTGIDVGPDQPNLNAPKPIVTGLPPGAGAAMTASGEQLAADRVSGASFQRDVFPLVQAIPALQKLGTKGTGPGTETFNRVKSFILSNVPGVKEKDLDSVKTYDEAAKYLVDFVNQTGNSGTNDKLAAAFAGNPSTHISNAAAIDVTKSALALRRMKQAQLLTFEQTGLPESEYSKWNASFTNALDPRAFGVDLMDKTTLQKMYKQIDKNKTEAGRFDKSLDIAHKLGFITPPGQEQ